MIIGILCKISIISISLPSNTNKKLNLVVCYGFGETPMLLITNLTSADARISVVITKVYLLKWRIEEHFRITKQQFGLEYCFFEVIDSSKRICNTNKFLLYALADGLFFVLNFSYTGILIPSKTPCDNMQISLFKCSFLYSA